MHTQVSTAGVGVTMCQPLPLSAKVFNNYRKNLNIYGDDVEVDYKGYEVREAVSMQNRQVVVIQHLE